MSLPQCGVIIKFQQTTVKTGRLPDASLLSWILYLLECKAILIFDIYINWKRMLSSFNAEFDFS
jgi:hypothetical protein